MKSISYIENIEEWKNSFSFYSSMNVRFSETDLFGHMNNITPFIYFEEARIAFLKKAGFTLGENKMEGIPIVADLQCDYHKQVYFDEVLKLFVKVNQIGRSSIDIHYMGIDEQESICLTGRGALVYISAQTEKPLPIPEKVKDKLLNL